MKLKITVRGVAYEVDVEVLDPGDDFPVDDSGLPSPPAAHRPSTSATAAKPPPPAPAIAAPTGSGAVAAPVAGTVVGVKCAAGDSVKRGDVLVVLEAMKMNTNIGAPADGTVTELAVQVGDTVREGQVLVSLG